MREDIRHNRDARIESAKELCKSEIARITEEAEQIDKRETRRAVAPELFELFREYIEVGFTEEQAWELIKISIPK